MVFPEPGLAMTASAFGTRLRELLEARGMSYRALSARTYYGKSYLHDLATGRKTPAAADGRDVLQTLLGHPTSAHVARAYLVHLLGELHRNLGRFHSSSLDMSTAP